jgi:hypothetical protein
MGAGQVLVLGNEYQIDRQHAAVFACISLDVSDNACGLVERTKLIVSETPVFGIQWLRTSATH